MSKCLTEARTFSIHRLVQAVQMDAMELEVQRQWAERVVRAVNEVFPDNPNDMATWTQCPGSHIVGIIRKHLIYCPHNSFSPLTLHLQFHRIHLNGLD